MAESDRLTDPAMAVLAMPVEINDPEAEIARLRVALAELLESIDADCDCSDGGRCFPIALRGAALRARAVLRPQDQKEADDANR